MRLYYKNLFFAVLIITISSCSTMYIPSNTNSPLLEKKGEKQIDLSTSWTGLHLSGNYAFSEKYFVLLNGNYSFGNFLNYNDFWEAEIREEKGYNEFGHAYGEVGLGKFNILESKFKLEVFSGIGYGIANENETLKSINTNLNYESKYYLGFLQCNIGFRNKFLTGGGGVRLACSSFNYLYPIDTFPVVYNETSFNNIHLEPLAFVKFGVSNIKFTYKISFSKLYTYGIPDNIGDVKGIKSNSIYYTGINLSLGVSYSF